MAQEFYWEHRGVGIRFPCQPYPSQKAYTERVLDCLMDAQNGLLESPTGTGKTLALLCASIAWKQHARASGVAAQSSVAAGGLTSWGSKAGQQVSGGQCFRVFYSSRTHSQLAQVMAQLKRLDFQSAVALGSRDQLCIHPRVKDKPTSAEKNKMCTFLVKSKQCEFYNNFSRSEGLSVENGSSSCTSSSSSVMDIEDLVKLNSRQKVCPYFKSREVAASAEFVFLPYNYLLDRSIRRTLPASLTNGLVIIDEAHNVAKVCEESSSLVFDCQDIALAIHEIEAVIKLLEDKDHDIDMSALSQEEMSVEDAYLVKEALMKLEDTIAAKVKDQSIKINESYPGNALLTILEQSSMDYGRCTWLSHAIQQMVDALASLSSLGAKYTGRGLDTIQVLLKVAYADRSLSGSTETLKKYYNLHVTKSPKKDSNLVFNLWCFHPGVAMRSITECGTRSLVLTSGTLKPMSATLQELEIPFAVQFSGPHIISKEQILVRIIPRGVNNVDLCSTFQNRENATFLMSLGKTVYELMKHVPNGMLVFFPSYSLIEVCVESWKKSGVWDILNQLKTVVVEPRDKHSFELAIAEFRKRAEDRNGPGSCLMAVCRGKVAEGIDFSDSMARAVLITGIPFPSTYDPRIRLKKEYMDKRRQEDSKLLSGGEWYKLEAYRAVNQAIGRVIRHKNDFGAIYFLDKRFGDAAVKSNLTDWANENAASSSLADAVNASRVFFKDERVLASRPSQMSSLEPQAKRKKVEERAEQKRVIKKIVISSSVNNVLKYKATNVVLNMKQKLCKEELAQFKATLRSYKDSRDLSQLLELLTNLRHSEKLNLDEVIGLKEFVLEDDCPAYDAFLSKLN